MWTAARSTPNCLLSLYFSRASSNLPAGGNTIMLRLENNTRQREAELTGFQHSGVIESYFWIFGRERWSNPVGCCVNWLIRRWGKLLYSRWWSARSGRGTKFFKEVTSMWERILEKTYQVKWCKRLQGLGIWVSLAHVGKRGHTYVRVWTGWLQRNWLFPRCNRIIIFLWGYIS